MRSTPGICRCLTGPSKGQGFSLLELMIVCALAAILLVLAVPTYQSFLMRGQRSKAIERLLAAAACQEGIYAQQFSYNTAKCIESSDGYYELRFEPPDTASASGFVVVAEPLESQLADPCGSLILDQTGLRTISGPATRARLCWEGR